DQGAQDLSRRVQERTVETQLDHPFGARLGSHDGALVVIESQGHSAGDGPLEVPLELVVAHGSLSEGPGRVVTVRTGPTDCNRERANSGRLAPRQMDNPPWRLHRSLAHVCHT